MINVWMRRLFKRGAHLLDRDRNIQTARIGRQLQRYKTRRSQNDIVSNEHQKTESTGHTENIQTVHDTFHILASRKSWKTVSFNYEDAAMEDRISLQSSHPSTGRKSGSIGTSRQVNKRKQ